MFCNASLQWNGKGRKLSCLFRCPDSLCTRNTYYCQKRWLYQFEQGQTLDNRGCRQTAGVTKADWKTVLKHSTKTNSHWNTVDLLAFKKKKKKTVWHVLHFVIRCIDLLVVFIMRCLSCCGLKVATTLRLAVVFNNVQVVPGVPRKYIPTASRWLSASNGWLAIWVSEQLTRYRCT